MKKTKLISLFLIVLMISLIFVACGNKVCEHEYDNTYCDTKCNFCGKPYNIKGHLWATNDAIQCTHKATCGYCGLTEGEDNFDHLFTDENGNVLEKCARCNEPNPDILAQKPEPTPNPNPTPEPEPEPTPEPEPKINTTTLQYTYDYGWHVLGKLTLLCDDGYLDNSFGRIEVPNDIVAGDIIKIVHTGEIWTQESYPSTHGLYNGHLISYSFEYAPVIHLTGEAYSIEFIKSSYDLDEEYVIVDRVGNFVPLDEYNGDEIYLVIDQKRLPDYGWNEDFSDLDVEQPDKIIPIASMFAYNPRDLEDGVNVRSQKVTINLNEHIKYPWNEHPTNKYAGYIGYNESFNQYIKYAPNTFSYSVKVTCKDDVNEALELAQSVIKDNPNIVLSTLENQISLEFSNFDAYSVVQEELLDGLSNLESVEKIEVDYDETSANVEEIEGYEHYTEFKAPDTENKLITSYAEFIELFDLTDEQNTELSEITEETFENYYVIYDKVGTGHCREWIVFDDAKIIYGNIYYTAFEIYYADKTYCDVYYVFPALILVPKSDLGASIPEKTEIYSTNIDLRLEEEIVIEKPEPSDITEAEAIEIASTHFEKELGIDTPPDGFVYKPRIIEGDNTAYFYVFFDLEYVGDDSNLTPDLFNYFTYTYKIRKETGEIISIESDF